MISIPFTRVKVSWHVPVLLALCMAGTWSVWRGLVAFAILIGGLAAATYLFWPLVWLMEAKHRQPGESLRQCHARRSADLAAWRKSQEQETAANGGRRMWLSDKYRYVILDCGHAVFEYFPDSTPEAGDKFWCFGHRRFGPAQEQNVVEVDRWGLNVDQKKVVS